MDMMNASPLHYQITQELREELKQGRWKAGELFPTDKQFMEKYGVSSTTVRRAIYELVKEGWLERKPGKGTFVKSEMTETLQRLTGFFEEMVNKGLTPSAKIIKMQPVMVTAKLLEQVPELKEFNRDKLFCITKVQKMNNLPVAYIHSYWPREIGEELAKHDLTKQGMYQIVSGMGIILEEANQIISATVAKKEIAKALEVTEGSPLLEMRRIVYNDKKTLEVSVNYYRADRYKYHVKLKWNDISSKEGMIFNIE
ncbi:MAG: GntR family transcriptional regulator [Bacillota bacterium]|uniref:UTRA domain-containing protein n=1 Tax=Thermanaerosceptrum fracticalcis TaxID=1712410 RepID=A0A7G6E4G0_THEFR|nr:GntR family transcriptional regulator [Thermanaerosceptrum fracticalcis]QNB46964.1 UTRA domain-containing protein [Thermanaerosceptrum fracticalcis]